MGRSVFVWFALIIVIFLSVVGTGCSSGAVSGTTFPKPAKLTIVPNTPISLDLGGTQAFTTSATNFSGHVITVQPSYQSSNTSVVTVASNGVACAGTWDTLAQVCTPGSVGVAQVFSTARGVNSPPVTIYVHQHIDSITIKQIAPVPLPPPPYCITKDSTADFQVSAFSQGIDVTATAGQFIWQPQSITVATASNTASGLTNLVDGVSLNQVRVTGKTPGLTQLFASVANVNSAPFNIYTCPVKSISLVINGVAGNSFSVIGSGSKTVTPTVIDANNNSITGVPLTWSSSVDTAGTATGAATGVGTISMTSPGTTAVVASCTPPTCNIGLTPADPMFPTGVIYPENVITGTATSSSATEQTQNVWVSTTDCNATGNVGTNCATSLVPITSPSNVVGNITGLPATPNSMVIGVVRTGAMGMLTAFLGTDSSLQGSRGLMVATLTSIPPAIANYPGVVGKVLAVSPDGSKVILSDTVDTPNQVYVFDNMQMTHTAISLPIAGATAADFSPDGLKAFIVANTGSASTLYVYSLIDALQTIPLSSVTPANDISFLSEGAFAYIAGGNPTGVTVGRTCDSTIFGTAPTPSAPAIIKSLPNATQVLALDPPNIDVISVTTNLIPLPTQPSGCFPTVTNTVKSFNLGQGNYVPLQLLIAPDGSKAYVIASNLPSILVFDVTNQISSSIPLNGNTTPLRAALTLDGNLLYVAASDRMVHVLSTLSGGDVDDVAFPSTPTTPDYLCPNTPPVACRPNLIGIQPQ
jgi:hypothetical protein